MIFVSDKPVRIFGKRIWLDFSTLFIGFLIFGIIFNLWMWLDFGFEFNAVFAGIGAVYLAISIAIVWND